MAKANATENPTYPIYNMGGCETKPGSCNRGFKSRPLVGMFRKIRKKGSEVNKINNKKPKLIIAKILRTRATKISGNFRLKKTIAIIHTLNTVIHNNIDPSCAPQTAAIR